MEMECTNSICKYKWNYNGRRIFRACCPSCGKQVKLTQEQRKQKEKELKKLNSN